MAKKPKLAVDNDDIDTSTDGELDILQLDQNLEDVPEPELLKPGYYAGEIQAVEVKENQKGTGRYYAIKFVIPTDEFPPDYEVDNHPDGLSLFYNLLRVPTAGDRRSISNIRKFMEKLGLSVCTNQINPNEWLGQRAKLKVIHNEYQGVKRENIANNGIESAD